MTETVGASALAGWAATLDQLDWATDAAWVAVGRGDLEAASQAIDALDQPPTLPPLPEELADRATQVLDRLHALEALLASAQHEVRKGLDVTQRMAASERAVPRFIDRRS